MPQRRNAIKALRNSHAKHLRNLQIKTDLKKTVKKFTTACADKNGNAQDALKEIYKEFDKAAKRNVMHKKTAARRKARFAKALVSQKKA
ncbi:MAG: 30S ribosomal protein S20 [Candidatus Omnitrophica bacterium]|nr:30S ribosomal protein S20 [Candidatus Omnitrophota bacterium]